MQVVLIPRSADLAEATAQRPQRPRMLWDEPFLLVQRLAAMDRLVDRDSPSFFDFTGYASVPQIWWCLTPENQKAGAESANLVC